LLSSRITAADITAFFAKQGVQGPTPQEVQDMILFADTQMAGSIDQTDFVTAVLSGLPPASRPDEKSSEKLTVIAASDDEDDGVADSNDGDGDGGDDNDDDDSDGDVFDMLGSGIMNAPPGGPAGPAAANNDPPVSVAQDNAESPAPVVETLQPIMSLNGVSESDSDSDDGPLVVRRPPRQSDAVLDQPNLLEML
jgi:hypothetical protein